MKINIKDLESLNYEEGSKILSKNGYLQSEKAIDTSDDGDAVIRENWKNESDIITFEWYCNGEITEETGWWKRQLIWLCQQHIILYRDRGSYQTCEPDSR